MKAIFTIFLFSCCHFAFSKTLNLEELPLAITEYNKQETNRITSLEDFNIFYPQIEGALSANQYMKKYNLTKTTFITKVFGSIEHLTPEQLPSILAEWNKQQTDFFMKITSIATYNTHHSHIHGTLSSAVYQILYDINQKEFINRIFGNYEHFLSLEKLPHAVEEYNKYAPVNQKITSHRTYIAYHNRIEGALLPNTYQILHSMSNIKDFTKFLFSRIEHLTLEELPQAIAKYHNRAKFPDTTSLLSFGKHRNNILGALSFDTYKLLYGITEEEFEDMLEKTSGIKSLTAAEIREYEKNQNTSGNPERKKPPVKLNNASIPLITLEQTPQAILEYNTREAKESNNMSMQIINSWNDYKQYYKQIPGADSIENLEKQYEKNHNTLKGFTAFLLSKLENTLTPIELSKAIAKYNSEAHTWEQINDVEDYETLYYRILHAPTLEAFKQFTKENWNDLFQKKFGTIDNYIESILITNACESTLTRNGF